MAGLFVEDAMQGAVQNAFQKAVTDAVGSKAIQIIQGIDKIASKQGGKTEAENYKLLGRRVLIVAGVALVAVRTVTWIGGTIVSRKLEEQRVEKIVRRILEEERQKEAEAGSGAGVEADGDAGTEAGAALEGAEDGAEGVAEAE
jgi:hypothetical protein